MNLLTIDFETFYSKDFSLSKMPTDAYVSDPRFEVIGVGVQVNDGKQHWITGDLETIHNALLSLDIPNSMVVCHNSLFDGYILSQVFGLRPKLWGDTLGMARALYPYLASHSLANLAQTILGEAKGTEVHNMVGMRLADFTPAQLVAYGTYCKQDVNLTYKLYQCMAPYFPPLEVRLQDMTIRMFTEPELVGDKQVLTDLHAAEIERKATVLKSTGLDKDTLMSNEKLAAALVELGVLPPRKVSKTTGKETYAFAKTDKGFTDLLEYPDPDVQAIVAARLGVKSTIAETRLQRMIESTERGPLPVYLNYWGAKVTGRLSGGNGNNWQNLPARGPTAGIRKGICAPPGHVLVVGDSSNIELRVALACAGQTDWLDMLAEGVDLYCAFASEFFGRTITKADVMERKLGKLAMLSLQYGAGWMRFGEMVRMELGKALPDYELQHIVETYRTRLHKLPALWRHCQNTVLPDIYNGGSMLNVDVNGWLITIPTGILCPGHPSIHYNNLRKDKEANEWHYTMGRETVKTYGAKIFENGSQHIARNIVMWQTARIATQYKVALSVHDEAVCVVPESKAADCEAFMLECLQTAPKWCRGQIPLTGEVHSGRSYADAK